MFPKWSRIVGYIITSPITLGLLLFLSILQETFYIIAEGGYDAE